MVGVLSQSTFIKKFFSLKTVTKIFFLDLTSPPLTKIFKKCINLENYLLQFGHLVTILEPWFIKYQALHMCVNVFNFLLMENKNCTT